MTTVTFDQTGAGGQAPSTGAAAYACWWLGFRVFPLVPTTGLPALKAWPDVATDDLEQVKEWWTGEYAGYGVGIATGAGSDVWVLDIDVKKGVNGFDTLQRLRFAHGAGLDLFSRTMVVATPSGGAHLYFRWPQGEEVPCSTGGTNALGAGLDVRGSGGYVRGPGWGGYQVVPRGGVRPVSIAAAPGWLLQLAQAKPRAEAFAGRDGGADEGSVGSGGFVLGTARTLEALGTAPPGTRNQELNRAAFRLGIRGEMSKEQAWEECHLIMVSIGANDDAAAQRRTFESGWNDGYARRER